MPVCSVTAPRLKKYTRFKSGRNLLTTAVVRASHISKLLMNFRNSISQIYARVVVEGPLHTVLGSNICSSLGETSYLRKGQQPHGQALSQLHAGDWYRCFALLTPAVVQFIGCLEFICCQSIGSFLDSCKFFLCELLTLRVHITEFCFAFL